MSSGSRLSTLFSLLAILSGCTTDEPAARGAADGAASDAEGDAAIDAPLDVGSADVTIEAAGQDATPSSILFADDFERPDTTRGLGNDWIVHVQDGSPPSTFGIENGRAYPFFGEPKPAPFFHPVPMGLRPLAFSQPRLRVSVDLVTAGGSYDGLVVLFARTQTSSNELDDTYACGFLAAAKKLYIMKLESGVLDALAISGPDILPLPAASTSRLAFTLDGTELTCEISGGVDHTLTATDDTYASGYFGMGGGKPNQNRLRFDNFVIETL